MERNTWISVKNSLPAPLETVLISNGQGATWIGCRSDLVDYGDGYNWCWMAAVSNVREENGKIVAECEDDDLDVLYWHKLPLPPKY